MTPPRHTAQKSGSSLYLYYAINHKMRDYLALCSIPGVFLNIQGRKRQGIGGWAAPNIWTVLQKGGSGGIYLSNILK